MLRTIAWFLFVAAHITLPVASEPAAQRRVPQLELVAEWGCESCAGAELIGSIEQVAVAPDGTVFVTDAHAPVVRRFGGGRESVAFGREGQGPGEFDLAWNIGIVDESTIEVVDIGLRRLTRLDFDGNLLSSRPLARFPTVASYSPARGTWYMAAIDFRTGSATVMRLDDGSEEMVVAAGGDYPLDEDGEVAGFFPIAAAADGRVAIGDGNVEYRARIYDRDGAVIGEVARDIERLAKTDQELAAERQRRRGMTLRTVERAAAGGGAAPAPRIDPLKRHFHLNSFRYDQTGRLWVLTGRGNETESIFDLFDAETTYLGELVVPGGVTRFAIRGPWLVTAAFSDAYYPIVQLWRVTE